jgi:hypothetical protein
MYEGDYEYDSDGESLANRIIFKGQSQVLLVTDDCRDEYPKLYDTLATAGNVFTTSAETQTDTLADYAINDLEASVEGGYSFYGPYNSFDSVFVSRADSNYLSFCVSYSSFTGGAHGMYGLYGLTYDVNTGEEVKLSDVMDIDEDRLHEILIEKLRAQEDEEAFFDLDNTIKCYKYDPQVSDTYEENEYAFDWYLGHDGVHFYFGPYELAYYAYGACDVVIGYDEYEGAVNSKYHADPSRGYIVMSDIPYVYEGWEGNDEELHFVYKTDSDEYSFPMWCTELTLKQGDESASVEEVFEFDYDLSPKQYKIVTSDGREYIYVKFMEMDDYYTLAVFDITDGKISYCGRQTFHYAYLDYDSGASGEIELIDPDDMKLGYLSDSLGSFTYYGSYRVGSDGLPEYIGDSYTISWCSDNIQTTTKMNVTTVDENGNETDPMQIPAGTHLTPVRTDTETYIDCRLDDGTLIRLKYDTMEYPAQIDGVDVNELFENLQYAG